MKRAYFGKMGVLFTLFFLFIQCCSQGPPEACTAESVDESIKSKENSMIGYEDFRLGIEKISIGHQKEDVETILGEPESRSETIWRYILNNREGFPGIPPASGATVVVGCDIVFQNGRIKEIQRQRIKEIQRHWMDATGPPH